MTRFHVSVDPQKCQGFSACVRAAPEFFSLGLDQVAEVEDLPHADDDLLLKAARACPFSAITLTDLISDEVVFPPP